MDDYAGTCAGWRRLPHDAAGVIATNAHGGARLCRACWLRWNTDKAVDRPRPGDHDDRRS